MPNSKISIAFALLITLFVSCQNQKKPALSYAESLIPKPVSVSYNSGEFALGDKTNIIALGNAPELQKIAQYLGNLLKPATGFSLPVSASTTAPVNGNIYLSLSEDNNLGTEGYTLNVSPENIMLSAASPAGLFRGVQTLRQLFPPAIEKSSVQSEKWIIPSITITDKPEYAYRGSMLDVARHFFSVEDVKRYIDLIAAYKMNVMHLHLSDDQGWRIEIKSWPKLTEIGSTTQVGGGKGGFYTQEQYKDIVQYAADRYITIIPEIDMPGHTNAALASYPELNCNDTATK